MEIIAWIGSICLSLCAAPLAYGAIKYKKVDISGHFLWLWFFGELFTLIYVIYKGNNALTFNYLSNIILIVPVIYYKYRKGNDEKN